MRVKKVHFVVVISKGIEVECGSFLSFFGFGFTLLQTVILGF